MFENLAITKVVENHTPLFSRGGVLLIGISYLLSATTAYAQTASDLPSSANPSRVEQRLLRDNALEQPDITPPSAINVGDAIPKAQDGFILQDIKLEGVTAFDETRFNTLIDEYKGREVDLNVLNHLAKRITKIYREEGYFLSRAVIPQQDVTNGVVTIQVIEGRVSDVIIDDQSSILKDDYQNIVKNTAAKIRTLTPLHGPTLERYILLLNDHAGIRVESVLQPPQKDQESGGVDIVLSVSEKNDFTTLGYNNHGSRFVGPHQAEISHVRGGVFKSFDTLSLQAVASLPPDELQFGSIGYRTPLNAEGLEASWLFSHTETAPGLSLEDLDVEGRSTSFKADLKYPIIRSRSENWSVGGGINIQSSATEFLDEELIDDKTRALTLFTTYKDYDQWNGLNSLALEISKGFDVFNATETGSDTLSRQNGRSDFFKIDIDLHRQQYFGDDFQLVTYAKAQYAPHPLLSSQQFGYGGTDFGRAYDSSEITGDKGIAAAAEIRYTNINTLLDDNLTMVPFAFYDIGKTWNEDDTPNFSAASAGLGFHYNYDNILGGTAQAAFPLTKDINTPVMNGENGPRFLFSLNYEF